MQKYGGISRYFANLHYGIQADTAISSAIGVAFTRNAYITDQSSFAKLLSYSINDDIRSYKYNKWYSRYLINNDKFDILHPTFYNPYFLKYLKKPFVLTVHDMINERFPQLYRTDPTALYKKELIKSASHIIAISDFTKTDIQEFYKISDSKISVNYHGFKMYGTNHQQACNEDTFELKSSNYLLYVGDRYGYKNFLFFINAIAPLLKRYSISLICAGGKLFNGEELSVFEKLKVKSYIKRVNANDMQLSLLYNNALAFVSPSLYEGFGLPILEAFHHNCPVILSCRTALPEVAGNAAEYFDPAQSASIASVIESLINDPQRREQLKILGSARLKLFSFESCLSKTMAVYSKI